MKPFVNLAALALALAAPAAAHAQLSAVTDRVQGLPAGLAVPSLGAAVAEEPADLSANPAAIGFLGGLGLQYFHESGLRPGARGDGLYAGDRLGPLGVGYSVEWLRPGLDAGGERWRRSRLGLTLGDGRALSLGVAWTWIASRNDAIEQAGGWDLGLTLRPTRWLSIGAAMLGRDARLGGADVPVRYDLGLATRLWHDRLTLSADLLANDEARDAFRSDHLAFGAAAELWRGVALGLQVQLPVRDLPGDAGDPLGLVSLTWNAPHSGVTFAGAGVGGRGGWLGGARLSEERYRSGGPAVVMPTVDVDRELQRRRVLVFDVGDRDPYATLVTRLEAARDDPEVGALLVRIGGLSLGGGRVEELRALLAAVRARKPVLAYLEGGGTREYWLATAATAIAAPPGAPLIVNGISTSQLFLRGGLARLGIAFDVVKAGAYKSAAEPLVRDAPSPEAREATEAVLDDVFGRFVAQVAEARRLPPERVRALVDQGLFTAEEAKEAGLVDAVAWPDELERWGRAVAGRRLFERGAYRPEPERLAQRWGRPAVIQVVRVEGIIARGRSRADPLGADGVAGAETIAAEIHRAADDAAVRAIVLRIESGGGDGLASDLIWREAVRARRKGKPVIASMGDLAASGGYLVAVGADAILAERSTLTGSIGVFAAKPDLSGLLAKLSIHPEAYQRGENARLVSVLKPWTPAERAVLEKQIGAFYRQFVARVAEGRRLTTAEVEAVAGGRVWTGQQALERKLVDRIGTLADAIRLARERIGLAPDDVVEVRREDGGGALARVAGRALTAAPEPPLAGLARAFPELSALALLTEIGPVLAIPEEWVAPEAGP
ncbi:signal peptide peptidase SppA, 36K type [Anaeromyxobacter sp. K]|uniref:signal peptide peptidase SppA n=1 Tax=Anaeromyxobacter sp. (strain K) TaxID=447217 RepID=UPI00015FA060|nr:signal peptide peptidase SppA [Anaeromyxobacter sp. K]ACG72431.1 signal peptide peptidase SppA, 36K type [Anaeromyxobacter sp. K]